jgi:hypothetical protein
LPQASETGEWFAQLVVEGGEPAIDETAAARDDTGRAWDDLRALLDERARILRILGPSSESAERADRDLDELRRDTGASQESRPEPTRDYTRMPGI